MDKSKNNMRDQFSKSWDKLIFNSRKLFASKDFDKIIDLSNEVLEIDNEDAFAYFFRGIALWEKGDLKNGYENFKIVLKLHENLKKKGEGFKASIPAGAIRQYLENLPEAVEFVVETIEVLQTAVKKRKAKSIKKQRQQDR